MPVQVAGQDLQRNGMFYNIPLHLIDIDPGFNPRTLFDETAHQELMAFIKENGIPGAFLAYKDGPRAILVDGHRRLRAARALNEQGCEILTAVVEFEKAHQTAAERLITALSRNEGQRLTPLEEAGAFRRFVAWGWAHQSIATRVGKSVSYVTQRLALLEASPELTSALCDGTVTPTTAVQIVRESRTGPAQAALLAREPVSKEEKALKSFTKSLDKIGLDEAIMAFITYSKQEELEYLLEPLTLALKAYERHNTRTAKKAYIGDE